VLQVGELRIHFFNGVPDAVLDHLGGHLRDQVQLLAVEVGADEFSAVGFELVDPVDDRLVLCL
jgi:hypothetical protein